MTFKGESSPTEQPSEKREVIKRWREELPILTSKNVLVVDMEKFDQDAKPPEERVDIAVDAIGDIEETRQYLLSEPDVSILREEVIHEDSNRVRFYIKLKK